jgi:hypothetical protein
MKYENNEKFSILYNKLFNGLYADDIRYANCFLIWQEARKDIGKFGLALRMISNGAENPQNIARTALND